MLCESVSVQTAMLLEQPLLRAEVKRGFLPALCELLSAKHSDEVNFLALRCFSDVLIAFLNEERKVPGERNQQEVREAERLKDDLALSDLMNERFFSKLPMLLVQCADPVPSVVLRLLSCLFDDSQTALMKLSLDVPADTGSCLLALSQTKLQEREQAHTARRRRT